MRVQSVPPLDRLDRDDRSLLLYQEQLIGVGLVGATIVDLAAEPIALEDLQEAVFAELGTPPGDATAILRHAVDDLLDSGILRHA